MALALLRFRMKDGDEAARLARQATVRHREPAAFSGATLAAATEGDPAVRSILLRHAALYPDYPDLDRAARGNRKLGEEGTTRTAVDVARLAWTRKRAVVGGLVEPMSRSVTANRDRSAA